LLDGEPPQVPQTRQLNETFRVFYAGADRLSVPFCPGRSLRAVADSSMSGMQSVSNELRKFSRLLVHHGLEFFGPGVTVGRLAENPVYEVLSRFATETLNLLVLKLQFSLSLHPAVQFLCSTVSGEFAAQIRRAT
jgi:hypothetical protein